MHVSTISPLRRRARAVRHHLRRRRGLVAALLLGAATLAGLRTLTPPPPETVEVVVARRDLPAGTRLTSADVTTTAFPADVAPAAPSGDTVGRVLAGPVGRGEVLTGVRLVGPALAGAQSDLAGQTVLPVRLPDAGMASLLRPGDVVDVYATDPGTGSARLLATGVDVLAVPRDVPDGPAGGSGSGSGGALVVVGVSASDAVEITGAALSQFLTVTLGR